MDEDEIGFMEPQPIRHDKWSVLIRLSNYALNVTRATALLLDQTTDMLIEHKAQIDIDKEFKEITHGHSSIGTGPIQSED